MTTFGIGQSVPDFEASATGNKVVKLSDYAGKFIILYFYPKDNTPGCTTEGQNFRDHFAQFTVLDAVILGVSRDSVKVHENFKQKHDFPFDLVSDQDEALCQLFDVIKMKNLYGKQVRGIERSTFLIAPDGKLAHEWRKVKVKEHCTEVLRALKELTVNHT
ncbi:MAG: peroxiredoxin [Gammaproteobacteria bacterium HGW-Gammaproteobacteria-3]|nr:MAG: peroxiredoxin [Gammaproteobacteria bacterium HGW-Gammaproteobacteria-3]